MESNLLGVSLSQLQGWVVQLRRSVELDPCSAAMDAQEVDRIAVLEQIESACAAGQARLSVSLLGRRLANDLDAAAGLRAADPDQVRRGVAAEIGLARHQSPHRARLLLDLAQASVTEMPCTLVAVTNGTTSEYRPS